MTRPEGEEFPLEDQTQAAAADAVRQFDRLRHEIPFIRVPEEVPRFGTYAEDRTRYLNNELAAQRAASQRDNSLR